jgi:hypothetical protein
MGWWVFLTLVALAFVLALRFDYRQRRRGGRVADVGAVEREAMNNRLDIDAAPYEPARHAGQRDWATYRARDRRRSR